MSPRNSRNSNSGGMNGALRESEAKYKTIVENASDIIFVIGRDLKVLSVNPSAAAMLGKRIEKIVGRSIFELFPKEISSVYAKNLRGVFNSGLTDARESRLWINGRDVFASVRLNPIKNRAGKVIAVLGITRDITERMKAEEALKKAHLELEEEKRHLTEKNIAFQEVIKEIEIEKNALKDNVIINVNETILPVLKKMRKWVPRKYIDLLEKNLETLTSSFGRRIIEKNLKLTPREIEICDMIKSGFTTKEISGLMNNSSQTIDKHRKNIRRKLGLSNKNTNLTSFLQSL